jgi:hypothetical protein
MPKGRHDGEPTPRQEVKLRRCPKCGSIRIRPYSKRYYEGGRRVPRKSDPHNVEMWYCRCEMCGRNVNWRITFI